MAVNAGAALLQSSNKASSILMRRMEACDPCRECTSGTQKGICGYRYGLLSCVPYCDLDPNQPPEQAALGPACPLINGAEPQKDWTMLRNIFCKESATMLEQESVSSQAPAQNATQPAQASAQTAQTTNGAQT